MVPVRTCIGCRQQVEQNTVVRFALEGDQVVLDAQRRKPGRGAWLHPSRGCIDTALQRKAFHRAFRQPVQTAQISFGAVEALTVNEESGLERDEHPMSTDG
ncbi:YlxR family protein [Nesterenkonia sp. MY13]|uniref:YlxR family protein n=1 Tax=Nesterenkonia sedimenti TaxID=1463632 RepID=A0A7X8YF76_9MICC|nr:YlxR family protein [Nesterenkonia sedimenti]NLS11096.1 YlxR family protein [Nesterenkonia sedimenti]